MHSLVFRSSFLRPHPPLETAEDVAAPAVDIVPWQSQSRILALHTDDPIPCTEQLVGIRTRASVLVLQKS